MPIKSTMATKSELPTDKEYYISTKGEDGKFLIYESEKFRLSEIDLINLIKVCLIEERNKGIGRKLLEAYKDSTEKRSHITQMRLTQIGLIEQNGKPTTTRAKTK